MSSHQQDLESSDTNGAPLTLNRLNHVILEVRVLLLAEVRVLLPDEVRVALAREGRDVPAGEKNTAHGASTGAQPEVGGCILLFLYPL